MSAPPPVIYLLHGDDEFAIAQFINELEARVGDPSQASLNMVRLDGRVYNLDELPSVVLVMPFLAKRRLVILEHPLVRLQAPEARQRFLSLLDKIPPTTALVLVEYKLLTEEKQRQLGKLHWLESWAAANQEKAYLRSFIAPKDLTSWIVQRTREYEGQITSEAAHLLASLVDQDSRLADQEIRKLLAYVNFQRTIEGDDVHALTADVAEGDIFGLVDALGQQNVQRAMSMLRRLLETEDPQNIFAMIIRQFRLLLLTRELLDDGSQVPEIIRQLKVHPFVAGKLNSQAQRFQMVDLKSIYYRLLDIDEAIKTGRLQADLALELLVVSSGGADAVYANPKVVG